MSLCVVQSPSPTPFALESEFASIKRADISLLCRKSMQSLTMASKIPEFGEMPPAVVALQLETLVVCSGMASNFCQ